MRELQEMRNIGIEISAEFAERFLDGSVVTPRMFPQSMAAPQNASEYRFSMLRNASVIKKSLRESFGNHYDRPQMSSILCDRLHNTFEFTPGMSEWSLSDIWDHLISQNIDFSLLHRSTIHAIPNSIFYNVAMFTFPCHYTYMDVFCDERASFELKQLWSRILELNIPFCFDVDPRSTLCDQYFKNP
jgi:hypothetical protein